MRRKLGLNRIARAAVLVVAIVAGTRWLAAQGAATINGVVKSTQGKPVERVQLVITGSRTAEHRTAMTDGDGAFVVPQLPADEYTIVASCGDCSELSTTVDLGAGQQRRVELEVTLGSASTTIALDTTATTMDTSSARLGSNITTAEMAGLPVNGNTYSPLELGAPGAINAGAASFGDIRFHGQSAEQNKFTLDGVDSSAVVSASPGFSAAPGFQFRLRTSVDSIQEFRVDSAAVPASQGGASGAQVQLVSKSGEHAWHGGLFEYFRNARLNARNYFDSDRSKLNLNQFGGMAGGRLWRDKIFVFGSFETLRQRAGVNVIEPTVPAGAFDEADPAIQQIAAAFPRGVALGDGTVAFRNDVAVQNEKSYSFRVDYLASPNNRFFVRAQRSAGDLDSPDQTASSRDILANLRSNHVVGSWRLNAGMFVNEVLGGWNSSPTRMQAAEGSGLLAGQRIFAGETSGGFASPGGLAILPDGDLGSFAEYHGRSYQIGDHVTYLRGRHSLQAGFDTRVVRAPMQIGGGMAFHYQDIEGVLANEDADISVRETLSRRVAAREEYSGFVHDDWRLAPGLTVNLGARYEYFGPTREISDAARIFDLATFEFEQVHGGFYRASRLGFAPRAGLAWAPRALHDRTVVRLGGGVFQGSDALMQTLQPIANDAGRYMLIGGRYGLTTEEIAEDPATQIAPLGLDPSSMSHMMRNYQASLSVQQMLPGKFMAQAAAVGSVSRHLQQLGAANPTIGVDPVTGHPHRAHDDVAAITVSTNAGNSSFQALQFGLTRRFVDELTMNVAYNWSHSIGDTEGSGDTPLAQNPACLACERADNNFDVRHTLHASLLYTLPFGAGRRHLNKGALARVAGGWSMGAIWNARTGLPLNVTINRPDEIWQDLATGAYLGGAEQDLSVARPVVNVPGGGEGRAALRPDLVAGVNPYIRQGGLLWLNPAAFTAPMPGTFGNLGRNALRGPGFSQVDLQISRKFKVSERQAITFRAEAYNLLNRANFANPPATLPDETDGLQSGVAYSEATGGGFGYLNSTVGRTVGLGTSRQIQLSLRYRF